MMLVIIKSDEELANVVRAAEFLGIISMQNPSVVMQDALYKSENELEALLILNSIVLMQDYYEQYKFDIQFEKINQKIKDDKLVQERLKYLKIL